LAHAGAERAVAHDCGRYEVPAGRAGDHVGGDLTARERAVWEVPQRPLPRDRLVNAVRLGAVGLNGAKQRRVGGVDQTAFYGEGAAFEQLQGLTFAFW